MEYKKDKNLIYLRIDKGEELLQTIKMVCKLEKRTGYFQGIGACNKVVIGTYIEEKKDYLTHEINGVIEMISLTGNTTIDKEGNIEIHSHGVFSYLENNEVKVTGGHLKSAVISFTGEIILNLSDHLATRKYDSNIGINVWDL